ncbi:highly immunogenic outer capsid protein [Cronobacter phage vB_Cdu_VP8]|nr:highly immunogenic outer capsid protein [Cronobacter phage vB_Cdu_VP8]
MAVIQSITGKPYTDLAFRGKTSRFSAKVRGDLSKVAQIVWYVQPTDSGQIEDSFSVYNFRDSPVENGVYTIPEVDIKFRKTGSYKLSLSINGDDSTSGQYRVKSVEEPNFKVVINPTSPSIKPDESVQFIYNITDFPAGATSTQKWFVDGAEASTAENFTFAFEKLGSHTVRCEATLDIPGIGPITKFSETTVNCVKGTLNDKISVELSSTAETIKYGDYAKFTVSSNHPAGVTPNYTWQVNGISQAITGNEFTFEGRKAGTFDVRAVVSFVSENYEGLTVQTPIVKITTTKLAPITSSVVEVDDIQWGLAGNIKAKTTTVDPISKQEIIVGPNPGSACKIYVLDELNTEKTVTSSTIDLEFGDNFLPADIGRKTGRLEFYTEETDNFESVLVSESFDFDVLKRTDVAHSSFVVNGEIVNENDKFVLRVAPKDTTKITVTDSLDQTSSQAAVNTAMKELGKQGKFVLTDSSGAIPTTESTTGVFDIVMPESVGNLNIEIQHVINDTSIEYDKKAIGIIEVSDNPIIPPLKSKIIQETVPFINEQCTFKYDIENLPQGSTHVVESTKWYVNGEVASTDETLSVKAEPGVTIGLELFVNVEGYTPSTVPAQSVDLNFNYRQWPEIDLTLTPNTTTVKWGQPLEIQCSASNLNLITNPDLLVKNDPTWYLDDKVIFSDASDGSLSIIASNPGSHVIKASILFEHPEYEPKQKVIEKPIDITTEYRDMATTLTLTPATGSIKIGETQRFNATISGNPAGSSTTFKWEIDSVAQETSENYIDVVGSAKGTKTIKVTSTTKAEGAEDDVQTKEAVLTVNNKIMTPTVTASVGADKVRVGEQWTMVCDVTGAPANATIEYLWENGAKDKNLAGRDPSIGTRTNKCKVTVKAPDYDDFVGDSNEVSIEIIPGIQQFTVTASTSTPSVKVGDTYTATVTLDKLVVDAEVTYLWSTGETTKDISAVAKTAGELKLTCEVTSKQVNFETKTVKSNEIVVDVENNKITDLAVSIDGPDTAQSGKAFTLKASATSAVSGVSFEYAWNTGETGDTLTKTETSEGDKSYTVTVTAKAAGYDDATETASKTVAVEKVEPEVPDECPLIYVHPLPQRSSAYIWCGWWVMREIEKLAKDGKDWKTATKADSPYYCHLNVLAKMLTDFPEVDVQESRNGYIVHRSALEYGVIY